MRRLLKKLGFYHKSEVVNISRYMMSDERVTRYKRTSENYLEERLKDVNDSDFDWGEHYEKIK